MVRGSRSRDRIAHDECGGVRQGIRRIQQYGGAAEGDRTMLDALLPAVEVLGVSFGEARDAALAGALATVPLRARKGRASYLGERSIGHQDPGAASAALLVGALVEAGEPSGGGDA